MKGIVLLYDETQKEYVSSSILPHFAGQVKQTTAYRNGRTDPIDPDTFVVTYLSDEQLRELLPSILEQHWRLGFLPHPDMLHARRGFGVPDDLEEAISTILETEKTSTIDMLMVNSRPAFDTVVIGKSLSVVYGSSEPTRTRRVLGRMKNFFQLFTSVCLHPFTLEYLEKDEEDPKEISTAALGILVVQHGHSTLLSRKIIHDSYANDGMMNLLILAPRSVSGLVKFGILSMLRTAKTSKLPPFAGYIKTDKILIRSKEPIHFSVDDALLSAREVELEIVPKHLEIVPGKELSMQKSGHSNRVFKTQALPHGELQEELLRGPLPLIYHATADQFKDLFVTLRENARPRSSYLVLMFLSTLIATLGLFANSSPVVIGAMILAPLMSPIISLAMGVLRQDQKLIRTSLLSIGLGLLLGYICAVLLTWLTPFSVPNAQILSRTRPNLLDLGIAVGSGIAGAYAHSRKEVAQTLAGVAIAVALVPPLAVSGIGLGWLNWPVFSGALLLLVTNLAGIVLAAAFTFMFLGFSPFRLAKKGLLYAFVFVLLVSTPLAYAFSRMMRENRIVQQLNGYEIGHLLLRDVEVRQLQPLRLSVTIVTEKPVQEEELLRIKQAIEELVKEEIELECTIGIKL